LSFAGDYAIVGLSLSRHDPTFHGLSLQSRLDAGNVAARCGLLVIDLRTGDAVEWLRLEEPVRELYDVLTLPGVHRPRLVGFKTDEIRTRVWADPAGLTKMTYPQSTIAPSRATSSSEPSISAAETPAPQ
jgi:uncharacterized protein (TIGR03032 family)